MAAPAVNQMQGILIAAAAEVERRKRAGIWSGSVRAHSEYAGNPVGWMVDKLGIPENTIRWSLNPEYQCCYCPHCVEIGNAGQPHIWDGNVDPLVHALELVHQGKWAACPSGTGLSKTYILGAANALAFLAIHERAIVCSLAPKFDLLLKNMWKGIGEMWPRFKAHFPNAALLTGTLRMLDGEGEKEIWTASAFGAGEGADEDLAAALKGFHHPKMLWIIEEGQGISPAKVETIVKTATAEFNPIVMLGNPKDRHDQLAAFGRRPRVTEIRLSALDYPNYVCGREVVPGARSRQSVLDDLAEEEGDATRPKYLSQVRGLAPSQSRDSLIRWEWLEKAAERSKDPAFCVGPLALGVDPSDSPDGDNSAISRWQGACCTDVEVFKPQDAGAVGRKVYAEIMSEFAPINPRYVGIDSVGVGASTVNELKRLGVTIRRLHGGARVAGGVDVAEQWSATTKDEDGKERPAGAVVVEAETYKNLRAAVFWRLREDLRLGRIALPNDPKLFEELTAIQYDPNADKITIQEKKEIRVNLGRSPDRADAVAYGNYVRPRAPVRLVRTTATAETSHSRDTRLEEYIAERTKRQSREQRHFERALKRLSRGRKVG